MFDIVGILLCKYNVLNQSCAKLKLTQIFLLILQMKEKQVNHLQSLSEEFKRRDKERELLLKKKVSLNYLKFESIDHKPVSFPE